MNTITKYTKFMLKMLVIIIFTAFLFTTTLSSFTDQGMHIIKTDEGFQFYDDEKPVLFYQVTPKTTEQGTHSRANYCHPVYDLNGQIMTEDFPPDHLHQRGIFWAWHQVYIDSILIRDMWECLDFIWDIHDVQILDTTNTSAALRAKVYWKSLKWKTGSEPFAEETVTIRVHKIVDNARAIDFHIEILALKQGLRIGGSDDIKGYGGFSARIILPEDISMTDYKGTVIPRNEAVTAGDWINFTGTFGKIKSGFAIFNHPSNPGHPRKWILRNSKSMQNPVYPGREPVHIAADKPLVLKYRIILHNNTDIEKLFEDYCDDTKVGNHSTPSLKKFVILQNYPNPFNPNTFIQYRISEPGQVKLTIFDLRGGEVKTLVKGMKAAGDYGIFWNGTNKFEEEVQSGIYICSMQTGKQILTRKMTLLK